MSMAVSHLDSYLTLVPKIGGNVFLLVMKGLSPYTPAHSSNLVLVAAYMG